MNLDSTQNKYLEQLKCFLEIPSISADSKFNQDVQNTALWIAEEFKNAGCTETEITQTNRHPIVYGERKIGKNLPTVLVYGHYDVQPPDPLELWDSDPFKPVIKKTEIHPEGAIFARGACDDKGQLFVHVKAFEEMVANNTLKCNVKFLIEGEEEVASESLEPYLKERKKQLEADIILISDTAMISNAQPSIVTGLRGLSYFEVTLTGPSIDLHSGVYGGAVPNPINLLSDLISKLHDNDQKVTIPGFYDKVVEISDEEKNEISKVPFDIIDFNKSIGIKSIIGESGYSTQERKSTRPCLDVNGIWGGYIDEGSKTVIPSRASAKLSMRLVPFQDWKEIGSSLKSYLESLVPNCVKLDIKEFPGGNPYVVSRESTGYKAAYLAYKDVFGVNPVAIRGGGSIPIVSDFETVLGLKTILMGFGLDSDAIHSPNEHFGLFNFFTGIETVKQFYHHFSRLYHP